MEDITKEIEKRKVGSGFSTNPWLRFKLSPIDYECWQHNIRKTDSSRSQNRATGDMSGPAYWTTADNL